MSYAAAHLDEIEEVDDGRCPWRPVRHHLGIRAFGVNAWTAAAAGDRLINEHDEADGPDEELYLVLSGHASFEVDGERIDAPAGTLVFVQPEAKRTAFAEETGTRLLALGGRKGGVYEPVGWELWAPMNPLYQAGKYAEAADRGRAVADSHPEYPLLSYNVACCEALAGRTADALASLRKAFGASERTREFAKGDTDLDSLRDEPAFKELMGEV
jgi:hypothetical protein